MTPVYAVFLCVLVTVLGEEPKRCCIQSSWHAVMTNTSFLNIDNIEFYDYYVDYDLKKEAMQNNVLTPGATPVKSYRILRDYNKAKLYFIMPDGTCQSSPYPLQMFSKCVPDNAVYVGSSYVGLPDTGIYFDAWRFTEQYLNITITLSRDNCIPLIEGVKGAQVNTEFFFSGFTSPLKDRSVFDVPKGC